MEVIAIEGEFKMFLWAITVYKRELLGTKDCLIEGCELIPGDLATAWNLYNLMHKMIAHPILVDGNPSCWNPVSSYNLPADNVRASYCIISNKKCSKHSLMYKTLFNGMLINCG